MGCYNNWSVWLLEQHRPPLPSPHPTSATTSKFPYPTTTWPAPAPAQLDMAPSRTYLYFVRPGDTFPEILTAVCVSLEVS